MATFTVTTTENSMSGTGILLRYATFDTINSKVSENIPKYSDISKITFTAYVKETTNKLGNADCRIYLSNADDDYVKSLYYGNGTIPKNNTKYLEVPLDLTSLTSSKVSNAGHISYSGADRISLSCTSSFLSRDYKYYWVRAWDFTPPKFTVKTVAGTGGTVTDTATYDVTVADQTKQITATPNAGYKFVKWVDSNGNTYTDKTISVTISQNGISAHSTTVTYTAYFELDTINKIVCDTSKQPTILIDTQVAKAILIDTTKVYG